jgi:hypothetical protein
MTPKAARDRLSLPRDAARAAMAKRLRAHVAALAERVAAGAEINDQDRGIVVAVLRNFAARPVGKPRGTRGAPPKLDPAHAQLAAIGVAGGELLRDETKLAAERAAAEWWGVSLRTLQTSIAEHYTWAIAMVGPSATAAARERHVAETPRRAAIKAGIASKTRRRAAIKTGRKSTD